MITEDQKTVSRRTMLRTAGTGAAALAAGALLSPTLEAQARQSAPAQLRGAMATLKVAFIGALGPANYNLVKAFEAQHPDIKVQLTGIAAVDWDGFFTKLLALSAAGQTPDLAYVATEGLQEFAARNLSLPLDDLVLRDRAALAEYFADVHPTLVEAMMYNGHLYELPVEFNAVNMYYAPQLFTAAGLPLPTDAWTKDDFYRAAKSLTRKKGNQTSTYGYEWVVRLWGSWTPWLNANGGDLLAFGRAPGGRAIWDTFYKNDARAHGRGGGLHWGEPTANSAPAVEAMQFMAELVKEGISPVATVAGGSTLQGFFASQKVAMTPGGGFWAGGLHAAGMKAGTFDAATWPRWKSQRTHFGTAGYAMLKGVSNREAAWEFIKFTVSKPGMAIELAGNNTTPARKSFMNAARYATTGPKHWQLFYEQLDKDGTAALPAPPYYNQLANILGKYTTLAASGNSSVKQALGGMQQDLENAYQNQNQ